MTSLPILIKECAIYRNKFIGIAHYNETDKLAISEDGNLYIQPRSIYRYIIRKWNHQNSNKLIEYIKKEFLCNYITHITKIISIYNENKHSEDYHILLNANKNLLEYIYPAFVLLQKMYKEKEDIYNILIQTTQQITKYENKFKSLLN
jgi:hypothetical protein